MTRSRLLAATALALVAGGLTLAVTSTIDPVYQVKASAKVRPITGNDDLLGVLRIKDPRFNLRTSEQVPFLPQPGRSLDRIAAASGARLQDVELVVPVSRDGSTRLTVIVRRPDPEQAARDANALLGEFIAYRRRWYAGELRMVGRYLGYKLRLRQAGERNFPSGPPDPAEGRDAARILLRLERGTLGPARLASAPADPISPHRARDTVVAALIGGLVGWLAVGAWPRRRWRRRAG